MHHLCLAILLLAFFASSARAVTLNSTQTDYTTSGDITTDSVGISSSFSGSSLLPNKIKNLHIITTGNFGAVTSAYGIRSTGNYNQITNASGAAIFTTGNSGRGISVSNNSSVFNDGSITTQGSTSYGIYAGGDANSINNSGSIYTQGATSYGIYLNGDNNSANNLGSINTRIYGIYGNGDANNITNLGNITTSVSSAAHGIYVSAGSSSTATSFSHSSISNYGNINSSGNGIYNKDNYSAINNYGNITSAASSSIYGIRNEGNNAVINNFGTINSNIYAIYNSGTGSIINSYGDLKGGIQIGSGTLNIFSGNIDGEINGSGEGRINIGLAERSSTLFHQYNNFDEINELYINAASILDSRAPIDANRILIDRDAKLNLSEMASSNAVIQGSSDNFGTINIFNDFSSNHIGTAGNALANLNIYSDATLNSGGDIYANNIFLAGELNFLTNDNLTIHGNIIGIGSGTFSLAEKNQKIIGDFALSGGDIFSVTLKRNGVGSLDVTGSTSIDNNSKLIISTNSNQGYVENNTQYILIKSHSSSIINTIDEKNIFANSGNSNVSGLFRFTTSATPDSLLLNINRLSAAEITDNKNTQNIYQNLTNIGASSSGKLLQFQEYLDGTRLSRKEITKTINQLAPQQSKAMILASNNLINNSWTIIENRLEKINLRNQINLEKGLWIQAFGGIAKQKEIADDDGYNIYSSGIAFGGDKEIDDETTVGTALNLAKAKIANFDSTKNNLMNSYQASIYANRNYKKYFLSGIFTFGINQFNSKRKISVINSEATSKHYGEVFAFKIKTGVSNKLKNGFIFTPEAGLNFLHNKIAAYKENGADELNLKVNSVSANLLESRFSVDLAYHSKIHKLPEFQKFSASLKTSYGYALINDQPETKVNFIGRGNVFSNKISHHDKNSIRLELELAAYHKDNTKLIFDYSLEHRPTFDSHFFALKIREEF